MNAQEFSAGTAEFVTFRVNRQWLGVPVNLVQEVLNAQRVAQVPIAPPEVAGFLNLRGQIVTALDLRVRLALDAGDEQASSMNVVIRHNEELYALLVDEVGDVLSVRSTAFEAAPQTLDSRWREVCSGIVRREHDLLVVLSADELLQLDSVATSL